MLTFNFKNKNNELRNNNVNIFFNFIIFMEIVVKQMLSVFRWRQMSILSQKMIYDQIEEITFFNEKSLMFSFYYYFLISLNIKWIWRLSLLFQN